MGTPCAGTELARQDAQLKAELEVRQREMELGTIARQLRELGRGE